jgi:RNA polymerase sigma-70 factor (ECF subfamily)
MRFAAARILGMAGIEERPFPPYNPSSTPSPRSRSREQPGMIDDPTAPPGEVTQWLLDWGRNDKQGLDQMLPVVYEELHRLASQYLSREATGHTLQPTALVHEAYLRLIDQRRVDWRNRAQFLGMAASMMRRILVNHARDRAAKKRGGGARQVSLSLLESPSGRPDVDLIALEDAMARLTALDQRKSRVVELKFFGGLTTEEIAEVMDLSGATVEREWAFARAWLYDAIEGQDTVT